MRTAWVFDVDNTLTPSSARMDHEFQQWFINFQLTHETYLVSGSDFNKTLNQVGVTVTNLSKLVFSCCGNEVRKQGTVIHKEEWQPSAELISYLEELVRTSRCPNKTSSHIEYRTGLINFSTVGRGANLDQRTAYIEYDKQAGERESMAVRLSAAFPDLEFAIAGDTGIDIYPTGKDKSQILKWFETRPIIFFGDKTMPGGNDYALATVANLTHAVEDWRHTWDILRMVNL